MSEQLMTAMTLAYLAQHGNVRSSAKRTASFLGRNRVGAAPFSRLRRAWIEDANLMDKLLNEGCADDRVWRIARELEARLAQRHTPAP